MSVSMFRTSRRYDIGVGGVIIFLAAVIIIISILSNIWQRPSRERARRERCLSNLREIGLALKQYSLDNEESMPWHDEAEPASRCLGMLYPDYCSALEAYRCPSSWDDTMDVEKAQPAPGRPFTLETCRQGLSYAYGHNRGKPWTDAAQSTTRLAADKYANADYTDGDLWDRPNNHRGEGRNVVTLDGSARWNKEKGPLEADPEYEFEGSGDMEHDQTGPDWWSDPPER